MHTHLVQAGLIGRIAARAADVRVIVSTQHNAYYPKQHTRIHQSERRTWYLADGMVALSGAIEAHLRENGYRGPVAVIPTGVDSTQFTRQSSGRNAIGCPYVLSVGHFRDRQKGHDILARAFAELRRSWPSIKLVIVGDGPERETVAKFVRACQLSDSVMLLGNRADVQALMSECTLFVLASRWEGFGRVLIEAMAVGCPVIAAAVEGIPEVIADGRTGLLVPANNVSALVSAIHGLLSDPTRRRQLGEEARTVALERFTLDRMVLRESNFYQQLLRTTGV